jgi:hypothetical protein
MIFFSRHSDEDFVKFKTTQTAVFISLLLLFLKVGGNEDSVDVCHSQVFIDDVPVLRLAVLCEIDPVNCGERFEVCYLESKMVSDCFEIG